jgi:hypothetical protein
MALPNSCISSFNRSSKGFLSGATAPGRSREALQQTAPQPYSAYHLMLIPAIRFSAISPAGPKGSIGLFARFLYPFDTMGLFMIRMIKRFLAHVLPEVIRPLRILWNEMIGFLFFVISVPAILSAIRNFRKVDQDGGSLFGAFLATIFAGVMVFFGIHSFVRARRISRS